MDNTKYTLRYLPLFYEDLEETVVYITETLENPQAVNDLLDAVEKAILERLPVAESFELCLKSYKKTTLTLVGVIAFLFYVFINTVHEVYHMV